MLLVVLAATSASGQTAPARASTGYLFLSLVSGTYAGDQTLSVEAVEPLVTIRYSFRDPDGGEGPWIPYREPLALMATKGEEREYRILVRADSNDTELERRELSVRIDRRPPAPPRILTDPGMYGDPVSLGFDKAGSDKVFYTLRGDLVRSPLAWDGSPVVVGRAGERASYVVQAYAEDTAGNRSAIVSAKYTVDARDPSLEILSPMPGTFANPQTLALSFRNVQWVRYSLDGSDPAAGGIPYTGPVLIRKQGTTTVRIAAQPRGTSRPVLRREVTSTHVPEQGTGLLLDTESGTYPKGISPRVLSAPVGSLYYTLWEKTPSESDFLATSGISFIAGALSARAVTVRLRSLSDAGAWGAEYRYFYFIGQPGPSAPTIALSDPEPLRGLSHVQVTAPEDALAAVTMDGAPPVPGAPASSRLIDVQPQPGVAAITVKAVAFDGSGTLSVAAERRITVETDPGSKPVLALAAGSAPGAAIVTTPGKDNRDFLYEMTSDGSEPATPGSGSPRLVLPLTLTVPFGMQRTFKIKCSAMDTAGRALAPSDTLSVTVNRKPPARPVLSPPPGDGSFDEPVAISIATPSRVSYTVTSDGTTPRDPTPDKALMGAFVALKGIDGSLISYRLKLLAVDGAGNATEVYGPFLYTLDLRTPRIPPLSRIADGGRYNQRQVSPELGDSPWKVCYTMTNDGSVPTDPNAKSPVLTGATVFSGDDGGVTTFRLKLLAVSRNGNRTGERRDVSFLIDLKPPEVPQLTGMVNGGRYARPVIVTMDPVPADVRLYYSVSTGETDPVDPVSAGQVYVDPLIFDAPDGVRRDFTIRISTRDEAGNRAPYDRRYRFSVDRELPDDPAVIGLPEGGISQKPVTLTLSTSEGAIYYEVTENGAMPRMPTDTSAAYSSPLLLPGRAGASVTYRFISRVINELGNASRAARMITVTVDRTIPTPPPEPRIIYSPENPSVAYLAWDPPASGRLLYRLNSGPGTQGDFTLYNGPVSVMVAGNDGSTIVGSAVVENAAGARSNATTFSGLVGRRAAQPAFRGVQDGGTFTQRVEVRIEAPAPGIEVRFELSTDGNFPLTVTPSSPLAQNTLILDAADGETLTVRIAARAFDPSGAALPSEESRLGFVIDRTPPDPPVATGIENGGFYQDSRKVALLAAEGTIYYRLSADNDTTVPAQTESFRYRGDLTLEAKPGQSVSYLIVAYTVDQAGNRSREIRSWKVTIDQKIVYVSPTGNDYADGSRGAAVRSLGRALQIATSSSRKTIFIAAGQYKEDSQVTVTDDVTVVGGLDTETWNPLGLERWSVLVASTPWRGGLSLVTIARGEVTMKGIELRDETRSLPSLMSVWSGKVILEQVTLTLRDVESGQGLLIHGGSVTLVNGTLQASGVRKGSLLSATGGTVAASGTEFTGPADSLDFACIDLSDARGVTLKGVTIEPGAGLKTRGIRALKAQLAINASRVRSGAGSLEAVAIDARESELAVENSEVAASANARSPTAILSNDTSLLVSRSRIFVVGGASAVGISARGGDLVIVRSTIRGAPTPEYLALVRSEEAPALVADNLLLGADAGESVCLLAKGGTAELLNNTVVAGTGTTLTAGILVQGETLPRIVNNIIIRTGADRGAAIVVIGARKPVTTPVILTNSFAGWQRLLRVDYVQEPARDPLDVTTVDALNAIDGSPFGGTAQGNIAESPLVTFTTSTVEDFRLAQGSACVDAGTDLSDPQGPAGTGAVAVRKGVEIVTDLDGKPRPAPEALATPGPPRGWDIGAYELSE